MDSQYKNFIKCLLICILVIPLNLYAQSAGNTGISSSSEASRQLIMVQNETIDSVFAQQWAEYERINKALREDALLKLDTISRLAELSGNEMQLFHTNYERIHLIFNPEEPDAIWLADSLAQSAPQPYRGIYFFLVAQMLSQLNPSMGMKSDANDLRDVMKWSDKEVFTNTIRYADSAFAQLFEYGMTPASDFSFITLPGNVLSLPEMTLADLALMSSLQHPFVEWIYNDVTINALLKAIQYHQEHKNLRILLEYEISKLFFFPFSAKESPEESQIWQWLQSLEKEYGSQTAIDYEKGKFLYYFLEFNKPSSENVSREYSLQCKAYFDRVLETAIDTFYKENARLMLEKITQQEFSLLKMLQNLAPTPKILLPIQYRNIDTLYISVYRIPASEALYFWASKRSDIDKYLQNGELQGPVLQQSFALPNPVPYNSCHTDLFLDSLPKGNYLLLFQTTPQYDTNTILLSNELNITSIKIMEIRHVKKHFLTFTDAITGEPLSKLKVTMENLSDMRFHRWTSRNGILGLRRYETTWKRGHYVNDGPDCLVEYFVHDETDEDDDFFVEKPINPFRRVYHHYGGNYIPSVIILDRPTYRPGQTVFFKAYLIHGHRMAGNRQVVVELRDKDSRIVSSLELKTNKFGTVAGQFELPKNMFEGGSVCIHEKGRDKFDESPQNFTISAYKLPTFKVELWHQAEPLVIGDSIHFIGRAVSFTGTPLRSAKVTVTLSDKNFDPEFPLFFHLQTDENGCFQFAHLTKGTNEIFYYVVAEAVVTDINGETQTARHSLNLNHTAFYIDSRFPDNIDLARKDTIKGTISVKESNYHGANPLTFPVQVEIFRVEEPDLTRPLINPYYKKPVHPLYSEEDYQRFFPNYSFDEKISRRTFWPNKELVFSAKQVFSEDHNINIPVKNWLPGLYRIQLIVADSLGHCDTTREFIRLINSLENRPINNESLFVQFVERTPRTVKLMVSSALHNAPVYCHITQGQRTIAKKLLRLNRNSQLLTFKTQKSSHSIDVLCHTTRNNKIFIHCDRIWDDSYIETYFQPGTLTLDLTHWHNILNPGSSERWEMKVIPNEHIRYKEPAEVLVWMVDSSLYELPRASEFDKWIKPYEGYFWTSDFYHTDFEDITNNFCWPRRFTESPSLSLLNKRYAVMDLRQWAKFFRKAGYHFTGGFSPDHTHTTRLSGDAVRRTPGRSVTLNYIDNPFHDINVELDASKANTSNWESTPFRIRRDFRETAFFLPQLQTDKEGRVSFEFTVPDQLTSWRFYAQAHTRKLHTGHLSGTLVTILPLCLQSNAPRFLREGDTLTLRAKITNHCDSLLKGLVTLEFIDTVDNQPIRMIINPDYKDNTHIVSPKENIRNDERDVVVSGDDTNVISNIGTALFNVAANATQEVKFRIIVPKGISAVTYRLVAHAGHYGDGEERTLLVLPKRMLATETQAFFVPANLDTTITFSRFLSSKSPTLSHYRYTIEATTNPVWLAIQTLPALLHPDYESNDKLFAALFAAAILQQVKQQNPEPLPDDNLGHILQKNLNKLKNNQLPDGGWSWYGSGNISQMITCEIINGFYKLRGMGVEFPQADKMIEKAIQAIDHNQEENYKRHQNWQELEPNAPFYITEEDILYLYSRTSVPYDSSWLSKPYVQNLVKLSVKNIYTETYARQAKVALILHRIGRTDDAKRIVEALRQQTVKKQDQGMYWRRESRNHYYPWYEAPIEQQALIIEAFSEISPREEELAAMKQWMLLQKKGNQWQSSRATLAAVHALLLNISSEMLDDATTSITLGDKTLSVDNNAMAKGTGYLQRTWNQESITPELGKVSVRTDREHPVIGACYWQYWTTIDSVETAGSGLMVSRQYFHQPTTAGEFAEPVTASNPVRLGERITVRVTITTDRMLDFVHVSDQRPAAFEPANVGERYRWQQSVKWMESPRDESTEFFFQHLHKGTVLIEYDVFATQNGCFSTGATTVECAYAPEWRAQCTGTKIGVR